MDWERILGNWQQLKASIKEKWGQLTDNDLDQTSGRREQLLDLLSERYGLSKEEAERQLDDLTSVQKLQKPI